MNVNVEKIANLPNLEIERVIEQTASEDNNIQEYFYHLQSFVKLVAHSKDVHSLFVLGRAGIGKTYNIISTLEEEGIKYEYRSGNVTPMALYKLLYEHNEKVIVLDDTQGLVRNKASMGVLFPALWSPTPWRMVNWETTSKRLGDVPPIFEFKGKIIFCLNEVPKSTDLDTLVSRCFFYQLGFNYGVLVEIMSAIANEDRDGLSKEERVDILGFIVRNTTPATKNFDLRLQRKIEEIYLYDKENWQMLAEPFLDVDREKQIYLELQMKGLKRKEAIIRFKELTGKSARTYDRIHKEMKQ